MKFRTYLVCLIVFLSGCNSAPIQKSILLGAEGQNIWYSLARYTASHDGKWPENLAPIRADILARGFNPTQWDSWTYIQPSPDEIDNNPIVLEARCGRGKKIIFRMNGQEETVKR